MRVVISINGGEREWKEYIEGAKEQNERVRRETKSEGERKK